MNQYLKYSDELLMEVYSDMMDFSGKASDEMLAAINARGGLENWLKRIEQNSINSDEIKRITKEVYALSGKATDVEFLKTLISSDILSKQELHALIEDKFAKSQSIIKDRSITSKTIIGSIAGILIGSLICGSLLSFVIIYLIQMYFILIIPVYIICYFIIKLITRQSRRNPVVFIAAFIATGLSFVIMFYFFNFLPAA